MRVSRQYFLKNLQSKKFSSAFEAFLFSAGSASMLRHNLNNIDYSAAQKAREREDELQKMKQRYRTMIHRLRQDELISNDLSVTQRGLRWLKNSLGDGRRKFPSKKYVVEKSQNTILFLFDIPEKKERYRTWLRGILRELDFEMLQKSVWIGTTKIPRNLLGDLKEYGLVQCVEILEISKTGTIERSFERSNY